MRQSKYVSVIDWVKKEIDGRQLKAGDQFYTETEMCKMLGVSRQTIRNAMAKLEESNVLVRRWGSGTYVAAGRSARNKTIGVIVSGNDDSMLPGILKGIERVSSQNGYSLQLAFTHFDIALERSKLRSMIDSSVEGIIVEPLNSGLYNPNEDIYNEIESKKIPLIFLEAYYKDANFPHVSLDHIAAGRMAAEHLINYGHRKITSLFMCNYIQAHLRYEGYVKALMSHSIDFNPLDNFWFYSHHMEHLIQNSAYILKILENYTALVCYNDFHANIMVKFLLENGVNIPEDISIVSIDDSSLAASCPVPLTSVVHPKEKCGLKAAENIIKLIENPVFDATVEFAPSITERESVKRLC